MNFRPYKYLVVAVLQELDDEGTVVGERLADQIALYSTSQFQRWAQGLQETCEAESHTQQ